MVQAGSLDMADFPGILPPGEISCLISLKTRDGPGGESPALQESENGMVPVPLQAGYQEKNHMIPYQDTCIRFMKTAEPFPMKMWLN